MRKSVYFYLTIFSLTFVLFSCNDSETYADKLDKQKKDIKHFLNKNDIRVLHDFPSDSIFGPNDYYLHPSGTYIHVTSYGNKNKKATQVPNTDVTLRAYANYLGDTIPITNMGQSNDQNWIEFKYGNSSTYQGSVNDASYGRGRYKYELMSTACTLPLEYVGDQGEVSLIVPFEVGSKAQQTNYKPLYFKRLRYNIIKDEILYGTN